MNERLCRWPQVFEPDVWGGPTDAAVVAADGGDAPEAAPHRLLPAVLPESQVTGRISVWVYVCRYRCGCVCVGETYWCLFPGLVTLLLLFFVGGILAHLLSSFFLAGGGGGASVCCVTVFFCFFNCLYGWVGAYVVWQCVCVCVHVRVCRLCDSIWVWM